MRLLVNHQLIPIAIRCCLDSLSDIIDYYPNVYDNHIVIGDFNLEPSQMHLETFMETHNNFNLIKNNTCFKGPDHALTRYLKIENIVFKVLPHLKQD